MAFSNPPENVLNQSIVTSSNMLLLSNTTGNLHYVIDKSNPE